MNAGLETECAASRGPLIRGNEAPEKTGNEVGAARGSEAGTTKLVVFSSLFPHPGQPNAGLFVRERMFRVGDGTSLVVVAPVPWFPLQALIRTWRPHFRPPAPALEVQHGVRVFHPRFLSVPGRLKWLDGLFMALGALSLMRRLRKEFDYRVIDSHFAYPDGYAATLLGSWLNVPVTITVRGTEVPLARTRLRRRLMQTALRRASHVFAVARALAEHAKALGAAPDEVTVVPNGIDMGKFRRMDRTVARRELELDQDAPVLVSVGGLSERKGFHRVIALLPELRRRFPGLVYLVVGGACPEGDWRPRLEAMAAELNVGAAVRFLGPMAPERLRVPLSAADVFVLATRNEGWANVFLEAMACGLPVVTTDVGGNREVVAEGGLGTIVPFGEVEALKAALEQALTRDWDRDRIVRYAEENAWDTRIPILRERFAELAARYGGVRS
ncbi:MAG: glycosyltransferase [Gammaproteobacteria bacterium]